MSLLRRKKTQNNHKIGKNKTIVCPTVTATTLDEYNIQIQNIASFVDRVHLDLADGVFTDNKLISLDKIWWPSKIQADIHLMYEAVVPFMTQLIALRPRMVVVHAEAVGNYSSIAQRLHKFDIKVGVALLQHTPVKKISEAISEIDHVLLFSGDLGHFGGHADLSLLSKIGELRKLKPNIEIGWDGGINEENALQLVLGGVDVLNVGGAIQKSQNPKLAYDKLKQLVSKDR